MKATSGIKINNTIIKPMEKGNQPKQDKRAAQRMPNKIPNKTGNAKNVFLISIY